MSKAYYNEIDPYAAQWLRNLIAAGQIADGDVDERSIKDVKPDDLIGYTQCHFFAGIGVWSYALRRAGWPDDRPVWTGSCPCQPFSSAGKKKGKADERHLWPDFFRLIRECQPITVFGEQVASKDGLIWLDDVCADMEGAGYTIGAVDFPACGVGAPYIRNRLYFVAHAERTEWRPRAIGRNSDDAETRGRHEGAGGFGERGAADELAVTTQQLIQSRRASGAGGRGEPSDRSILGNAARPASARQREHGREVLSAQETEGLGLSGPTNGYWANAEWLHCRDGKARPTEPGLFPLADGLTNRVGRLRAYGNALVAPQAQAFIESFLEAEGERDAIGI